MLTPGATTSTTLLAIGLITGLPAPASGQLDSARAATWFQEADSLCHREAGRHWGVSLCGPMAFVDAASGKMATSEPPPAAPRPRAMGYANTAVEWGEQRWATYMWLGIPAGDYHSRTRLLLHELFHRIQPQLGLMTLNGTNYHLDTFLGRFWMRLEWRALARALAAAGPDRTSAIRDALAFRHARHEAFAGSAENERVDEVREGLAQYTGTVASVASPEDGVRSAIGQLREAESQPTFVRTFAYPSGAAYGILLDALTPGWTRRVTAATDLGLLLQEAAATSAFPDAEAAALRYDGAALREVEVTREEERKVRVAELQRRFVDGPVLVFPRATSSSFVTTGATPIPGHGTVYVTFRTAGPWGSFETTTGVLLPDAEAILVVPAPRALDGRTLTGEGWSLSLNDGWVVKPGPRPGDFRVVPEGP